MSSLSDHGQAISTPVEKLLDGVMSHFITGNWKEAKVDLSNILVLKTISRHEILRTLLLRGTVHMKLEKPRLAVQDWQTVLVLDPKNESARTRLEGERESSSEDSDKDSDGSSSGSSHTSHWRIKRLNIQDIPVSFEGEILVTRCDTGAILGYINDEQSQGKHYSLTKDHSEALSIAVEGVTPFEIRVTGTSILAFLGWSARSNPVLKGGSYGSAILMRTVHSEPNTPPLESQTDPLSMSESSVWYYDHRNRRLTAEWINPDGSSVPNGFCVAPSAANSPIYLTAHAPELAARLQEDGDDDTPQLVAVHLTMA